MWSFERRTVIAGLAWFYLVFCPQPSWASSFGSACVEYDADIKSAVDRWWPDLRVWKLWRSQLYAESQCDTDAVSPVGARGVAQLMPLTARDLAKRLGVDPYTSPHVAKFAIPAGAAYVAQLRAVWQHNRIPLEQHWLAVASYNRGRGNILHDQAECSDARLWDAIAVCTMRHTLETSAYVARVNRNWQLMEMDK